MKSEMDVYESYLRKIRLYSITRDERVWFQIDTLGEILGIDSDDTYRLIKSEIAFTERDYKKDTLTFEYSNLKQRESIIKIFSKKCNGNYKQLSTNYIESNDLDKGIVLIYKPCETEEAILTHGIYTTVFEREK